MTFLTKIDAWFGWLTRLGFLVASALLLVIAALGTADVITTNLFMKPIRGVVEISSALLGVIVFLGLAQAQRLGSHIMIDIATMRMPPKMARFSAVLSLTICAAFMALMAVYTTKLAMTSWAYNEKALGGFAFPIAPFKSTAAFGAWLACAEFVRQIVCHLCGRDPILKAEFEEIEE